MSRFYVAAENVGVGCLPDDDAFVDWLMCRSLLEASVDVERATRVAPPPTAELAMTLLDMIKKRCLDENWDDVTPR